MEFKLRISFSFSLLLHSSSEYVPFTTTYWPIHHVCRVHAGMDSEARRPTAAGHIAALGG
ncbi:hypothetical protein KSB_79850 [Ktedonobacter robiniae]|uniref:Uncharacterized protein n=1 Tax=Ktedonobacter robiniae TaxID=2778365 RepID=A0ABQ3V4J2_9CHLR|nr:hypothetical protein KSB_79850 [Ktedonobacter robiniae]